MRALYIFLMAVCMQYAGAAQTTVQKTPAKPATQPKIAADDSYQLDVVIKPLKNCWIYLGTYYSKNKILVDSAWFDNNSKGTYKGNKKLYEGIYFFVSPSHTLLFEILIDKTQHFSVIADSAHLENLAIAGSPENEIFAGYTRYLTKITPQLNEQRSLMANAKTAADSAAIDNKQKALNKELNDYRQSLIDNYPESMVASFFQTLKVPEIKTWPLKQDGTRDSLAAWQYMKEHFWDNVNFSDNSLVRTPFFDPKLDDYYKNYVSQEPDSVIKEVNYMMLSSRGGKEIHHFLLGKFTDKYINPAIMGQDKVFLFLFDNYFSKGDTLWLNEKQRKYIFDRAYSLMANQLNLPAPQLDLKDMQGKVVSLYSIKAPFTFVAFWDPTCGHCKTEIPLVDSIYKAKWKALGVAVYSVNTNENTLEEWKKFIQDYHLDNWHHVWQTKEERTADEKAGRANYRQLYDVFQTPTMYLLDADKQIIAKKLSIDQYDALIEAKLKLTNKKTTN